MRCSYNSAYNTGPYAHKLVAPPQSLSKFLHLMIPAVLLQKPRN